MTKTDNKNTKQLDDIIENIVLNNGSLSRLTPQQKVLYYNSLCEKFGLNRLTKPFQLINFQGKEILYATKDATEQLRKINGISIFDLDKLLENGLYIVTAKAEDGKGRKDAATGAVNITGLKGDALANAIMKGETKAKRRVTLSICGLGILDESETDTIGEYTKLDIHETKKPEDQFQLRRKLQEEIIENAVILQKCTGQEELATKCKLQKDKLIKKYGNEFEDFIQENLKAIYLKKIDEFKERELKSIEQVNEVM